MKDKGLYIVLTLYSLTRWFAEYFDDNYDMFDANILYFMFDGFIICCIGLFLYANSKKDLLAKLCLFLLVFMGISQSVSFFYSYFYTEYLNYSPWVVAGIAVIEVCRYLTKEINKLFDI